MYFTNHRPREAQRRRKKCHLTVLLINIFVRGYDVAFARNLYRRRRPPDKNFNGRALKIREKLFIKKKIIGNNYARSSSSCPNRKYRSAPLSHFTRRWPGFACTHKTRTHVSTCNFVAILLLTICIYRGVSLCLTIVIISLRRPCERNRNGERKKK